MARHFSKSALHAGTAAASLVVAAMIAVGVYLTGPVPMLHDVASEARMPIPGTADVELPPGSYGLYFGDLNAPRGKVMGVPSLDITIVPPPSVPDPAFVNVPPKADDYVDGYHTVQVASITVATPGTYHMHVQSREQNGGSFSIGQPPALISPGRNVLRATPFIALFALLGIGFTVATLRARLPAIRAAPGYRNNTAQERAFVKEEGDSRQSCALSLQKRPVTTPTV